MMHRAWSSIVEVPYCFSRSYVKFQGHTALKNRQIWPKLGVSGQQLQFEFTNGYEMLHKAWNSKGEMPFCFPRSSIKFQGHTGQNITDFDPNWTFPDHRPVAAFKSLRFALFNFIFWQSYAHSFVKNKAINMIFVSYWSIPGVLNNGRELLLIYFLKLLKNSSKCKIF